MNRPAPRPADRHPDPATEADNFADVTGSEDPGSEVDQPQDPSRLPGDQGSESTDARKPADHQKM